VGYFFLSFFLSMSGGSGTLASLLLSSSCPLFVDSVLCSIYFPFSVQLSAFFFFFFLKKKKQDFGFINQDGIIMASE
jgi:hypothetical protein